MTSKRGSNHWKDVIEIVNLTPHVVSVMHGDSVKHFQPSGNVARVNTSCEAYGDIDGTPVVKCTDGIVRGLPEEKYGTIYLVSSVVAKAVRREDVLSPDTSDDGAIRDGRGYIIAVKRLQSFY